MRQYLLPVSLLLLFNNSLAYQELTKTTCTKVESCSECISSIDRNLTSSTKCLPIVDAGCAPWAEIEAGSLDIDYSCGQELLSEEELTEIDRLLYYIGWNQVLEQGDLSVSRMEKLKVIKNETFETTVAMGYDPVDDSIVSIYVGTSNKLNWILDFDFFKTEYEYCEGCEVHRGFYAAYKSLSEEAESYLQELASVYPNAMVVVTGHSLGGAEAALAALAYERLGFPVALYTLGQPRVGNLEFVEQLNTKISFEYLRAVYREDPVPTVPFNEVTKFYHGGREIHFYACAEDSYVAYPDESEDYQFIEFNLMWEHFGYFCLFFNQPDVIDPPYPIEPISGYEKETMA